MIKQYNKDSARCILNSYTHAPWSLQILETRRPEALAHEHSEGTTKGLRVYKICRLHSAYI